MILSKLKSVDMREYSLDQVQIPRMYFLEQPTEFDNKCNYLSEEFKSIMQSSPVEIPETENANAGPSKRSSEVPARDISKRSRNA